MAEYKVGDRLRGTATHSGLPNDEAYEGEFQGSVDHDGWPFVYGDDGLAWYLDSSKPITVVKPAGEPRPLVGPAPKVEAPVFLAPFKARDSYIVGADGREVLAVSSLSTTGDQDDAFAAYVAEALNARVFGEE